MNTVSPRFWSSLPPARASEPARVDGAYVLDELRVEALLRAAPGGELADLLPSWTLDRRGWTSMVE